MEKSRDAKINREKNRVSAEIKKNLLIHGHRAFFTVKYCISTSVGV